MKDLELSARPQSPLPAVIVTSLVLGLLAYLMLSVAGETGSTAFIQFGAALAILVYLLTFVNIRLGVGILILCVGLSPEVSVAGFSNLRFEDFLVPALLAAWILRSLRTREEFAPNPLKLPWLLYLTVMTISAIFGIALGTVQPTTSALMVGKNIIYFLIFLIVLNNIRTYAEFKAFVIFAMLVSLAGALLSLSTSKFLSETDSGRVHGPFGETANIFGGYLVMHLAIFVSLFLHLPSIRGRIASLLGVGALFYTLMFTFSRTSYMSLLISITLFSILKYRRLIVLVLVLAVLFPLLAPGAVLTRFLTIVGIFTGPGPESWEARVSSWEDNRDRIFNSPLFGSGPSSIPLGDVDSEYVRVAIDIGVLGILGLAWLLGRLAVTVYRLYDQFEGPSFLRAYAGGYFMCLTGIMVHAFGATSFSAIRTMESFMILSAFMVVLHNRHAEWKAEDAIATADELREHSAGAVRRS